MNADDVVNDIRQKMTDRKSRCYSEPSARRSIRRPEEILRDVRGLKLRQRVSLVLNDEILREELEDTIKNSNLSGVSSHLGTIRTYQDFLLPALQPNIMGIRLAGNSAVTLPINDIRGQSTLDYSKTEKLLRCKLAAVYRLVDIRGWSESIFNHISVKLPGAEEFILNPFGLLFSEITSSSLIKCDIEGTIIDSGSTSLGLNKAGFVLHSCIYEARPEFHCVIHVHTPTVVAVSAMKCGLLMVSQESLILGNVSYHDYCGILVNEEEKQSIREDLGPDNKVMILRNHGVVVCGKTVEEAYLLLENVMEACEIQIRLMPAGLDNIHIMSNDYVKQVQEVAESSQKTVFKSKNKVAMTISEYHFEAQMRWLDSQGYRTGYLYHMPDVFVSGNVKKFPESRVPPQVSSDWESPHQIYHDYHNKSNAQSVGRGNTHRNRFKWLNSPVQGTQYVKEERKPVEKAAALDESILQHLNGEDEMVASLRDDDHEEASSNIEQVENKVTTKDGTTIITQTTTVVKKQLVTEELDTTPEVHGTHNSVNGLDATINSDVNGDHVVAAEGLVVSSTKSATSLNSPPSDAGSVQSNEQIKSPQKVKKQKSFKKALMKKLHKKEEKKEEKLK